MVHQAAGRVLMNQSIIQIFSLNCFELAIVTPSPLSCSPILQLEIAHDYLRNRRLHLGPTDLAGQYVKTVKHIKRHGLVYKVLVVPK